MVLNIMKMMMLIENDKIERCCDEIGVKVDSNEIDRVNYIGKLVFDTIIK